MKKKEKRKTCDECEWYDWSTERDFNRKVGPVDEKIGERTEIVGLRALCRNPKAKSYQHLVKAEYSKRQCAFWERGKYKPPKQESKPKKETKVNNEKMASPNEYFGTLEGRLKKQRRSKNKAR